MIHAFLFLIIEFHFKVSSCKMGRLLIGSTAKAAAIMRNASPCFLHHESSNRIYASPLNAVIFNIVADNAI